MPDLFRSNVAHGDLMRLVPEAPGWRIEWPAVWGLWPDLALLDDCPQDPVHHGEGDVGTHTRMVVEALVADEDWQSLPTEDRALLFWAAVLHDVGKPATTRNEADGRITSRGHSRIGASMARSRLREAGSPFAWREDLCGIIATHQLPFWLIERCDPERLAIRTSWQCRPDLLCLHAMADAQGRICNDQASILDNTALARTVFEDQACLTDPFRFANDASRVEFFEREDRNPQYAAHEAFRCTVTLMAGLPGSGKDRWIARNRADLPVVSLDSIRQETGVAPTDNQGVVVQAAHERARSHLRAGQDFVWNATNVTRQIRAKVLRLLLDYGARVEIVYIEVLPDLLGKQNRSREDAVPQAAIDHLVRKLEPPQAWEAHTLHLVVPEAS